MLSAQIRETFLKYFEDHGHQRVKSSSLIPAADPTLLFTNAGMNQFKDAFLGLQDPGYRRAASCQKCVRAGGKHNDLENVGFTARHHTFFEMLGNFSFGDYFKKDAIAFAWELVTQHYKIDKNKLRVTVFEKDDEAFDLWKKTGVPAEWIYRLGEKDNFWAMGDTGPCGPCSEIYFDWGPSYGCGKPTCNPGCECGGRFLEIWNLVFMQFNRTLDGKEHPLPKPSVDTGAGLERLAAVLQGKYNNYDTDVFSPITKALAEITQLPYGPKEDVNVSMRVIADHIRSGTFLLSDGVTPSNEGRGYVLRRILRRAIRHGKKLGQEKPFLHQLVKVVAEQFKNVYPELTQNQRVVEVMLKEEEERFHETLHRGMGVLESAIADAQKKKEKVISGDITFKLYDTFGFPLDLTQTIAAENKLGIDEAGFHQLMEKQRSQSSWKQGDNAQFLENVTKVVKAKSYETGFLGYEGTQSQAALQVILSSAGEEVPILSRGEEGFLIFDRTPFYAESGGQVGDKGTLSGGGTEASISDTLKVAKAFLHRVKVEKGKLTPQQNYDLKVDTRLRKLTAINHTATHMLHAALRGVLGERVKQAGSLVDPTKLRFDFTYPRGMTGEEIEKVESLINEQVSIDSEVTVKELPYNEAIQSGAIAFFDEKYGDRVRVVRVGSEDNTFSVELCGGTHLSKTSDVGFFKVLSETSVASGVRRIEAITSVTALEFLQDRSRILKRVEAALNTKAEQVPDKLDSLLSQTKQLQKENEHLKVKVVQSGSQEGAGPQLHERAVKIKDLKLVAEMVPSANPKILRTLVDQIRDKLKDRVIVVLATEADGKASICVGITKDLIGTYDASKLIQPLAKEVGGTGGGRPDFSQAGGTEPAKIKQALEKFKAELAG